MRKPEDKLIAVVAVVVLLIAGIIASISAPRVEPPEMAAPPVTANR